MKIIFNTFKYGNARTKFALLLMATGLLAGFGILTYSLIVANYVASLAAILILVADVGFILSTDFRNLFFNSPKKKEKASKKKYKITEEETDDEEGFALEWVNTHKKKKYEEIEDNDTDEDEIPGRSKGRLSAREAEDKDEDVKKDAKKEADIDPFKLYNQKKYKQILVQYKVKQDHELILIDNCQREKIFQCPAILWKDKTTAYILLIEAEPRMIKYNMYDYNEMHIRVGVDANPSHEYMNFKEGSFLGKLFIPLLPNYTTIEDQNGRKNAYKKALYGIGPDIFCTSNSVKNILKVLSLNMVLTESKIQKGSYSDWFKRIYISRLMYRDKIFSAPEYQAQVMGILDQMAEKANDDDFANSITQMLLGGLIPQEYADYANFKRK
ncbi:MAG: hypothetical protein K6F63_05955 [Lachnospiraceae bacterium]|nr:hypothetical protein [Lachnospiraceae bacterium]